MKKTHIYSLLVAAIFIAVFSSHVFAGGCCYKSFSATTGVADKEPVKINAAFVDPIKSYSQPNSETVLLANEQMALHIISPKPGQNCQLSTGSTNGNGEIEANCYSSTPGTMKIYFSAPNQSAEANQSISAVPQSIQFQVNPDATPTPAPITTATPAPTAHPTATPTATPVVEVPADNSSETAELKNKVSELEEKVQQQQEQVSALQAALNKIMSYFHRFFH